MKGDVKTCIPVRPASCLILQGIDCGQECRTQAINVLSLFVYGLVLVCGRQVDGRRTQSSGSKLLLKYQWYSRAHLSYMNFRGLHLGLTDSKVDGREWAEFLVKHIRPFSSSALYGYFEQINIVASIGLVTTGTIFYFSAGASSL